MKTKKQERLDHCRRVNNATNLVEHRLRELRKMETPGTPNWLTTESALASLFWLQKKARSEGAMTADEQTIIDLTRENSTLKIAADQRRDADTRASIAMGKVGVPVGFEDGNSWDDYGFHERIHILCEMYQRLANQPIHQP